MKIAKDILLYTICEPGETCISAQVIFIINVTQPVITSHTLYLHSSKNQAKFMYMISILVGPVTIRCKSLCDWVGHELAVLNVLYHSYIVNCLRWKTFVVLWIDWQPRNSPVKKF